MRKLIFGINLTLDGCCDHTKGIADEDVHGYFTDLFRNADTVIYGRITYQLMVPFWPDMAKNNSAPTKDMNEFAQAFNAINNIMVFSRTLGEQPNSKVTVVNADLRQELIKLKQQEGKDILVGGVDLPMQLMQLDLIDEYHFMMQPLIVGPGRRLFEEAGPADKYHLQLVETKPLKSGSVALRYTKLNNNF